MTIASMDQVLTGGSARYLDHDEKFNVLPDLILMDGGLGQVGVACRVLAQAGLEVPVFGMVKDHRHRTRGLVAPGRTGDWPGASARCVCPGGADSGGDPSLCH